FKGDNLPVEEVSWNDCQKFIKNLNSLTGRNFRLPTEAEWEFAARGGNKSRGYKYSGSDNVDNVAWHGDNSGRKTHPVKTKQANELGIYDMSGNVYEWCQDRYGDYSSAAQTNPKGATTGAGRVIRGGGWDAYAGLCCSAFRLRGYNVTSDNNLGFRLVLSAE
ncbi:MAG: formylglycine-generating enzyme family protein, partial [Muribaculaceae bacterium]